MNRKRIIGIVVGIAIVALVVLKLKNNKDITKSKIYLYDKDQAISVQADTIRIEKLNAEFSYSGTFEPNKETKISTELQGKVNVLLVDVGSIVKKGQTLILLDNSLLRLQLQTIEIQIEGLEADVKRYTILAKADAIQGVQLEKAELGLKSAKLQRETILEQINKTTIKAPFNGIVTAKLSEVGAFAAPGVPLLQITDISILKFTVNVPENDLSQFRLNQSYTITADAYSEISINGKNTMIGSKANIGSSFPVQFNLKNTSDLKIKSGMFGKVNLENFNQEKGIIIPSSAMQGTEIQAQVFVVRNGKANLQNITILRKIQNNLVVSSGLNEGDIVVTNGFINLFDGAKVNVK
ncbi:MAG: efflux RND transporter periplasmic adaptor subunit [Bacteroidia bacterium]|nr:efflux RND transporter periplasmic adaptor subunit [Bacteroidia bacterium]MCF8428071.1 efflux RND transporter periplasmic adaptor subunit [Bacteroidia bacterium]MCF8446670.1 efflux RND transporter periplasmic adaptor subunit [Bacteroidia bacterium]